MSSSNRSSVFLALVLCILGFTGCNWISLAQNALTYRTIQRGEAANLVAIDSLVYATKAEDGLAILDGRSGTVVATLATPSGSESVDDLAIERKLLFVLDARPPGHLTVYSLEEPLHPRLVSGPSDVPVGPFSGVSASEGVCVVSGGTASLTIWRYDSSGTLLGPIATTDLGRGQPDALLAPNGRLAYVSTHYWGPYFGLDIVRYDSTSGALTVLSKLKLDGAGFTAGGAKPANFPIEATPLGRDTILVAYARGVAVINVAAPATPIIEEIIDVGGPAVNVESRDRAAVVAVTGSNPVLVILDFSASRARIVRRIPLPAGTFPTGVAFSGARVAVAARERGVLLFDQ